MVVASSSQHVSSANPFVLTSGKSEEFSYGGSAGVPRISSLSVVAPEKHLNIFGP